VRDELRVRAALPAELLRPMSERGAFGSVSCVLTNLGAVRDDSRLASSGEWLTVASRATVPLLAVATVDGRTTLQFTSPDALCSGDTLRTLLRALLAELGIDASVEPGWGIPPAHASR